LKDELIKIFKGAEVANELVVYKFVEPDEFKGSEVRDSVGDKTANYERKLIEDSRFHSPYFQVSREVSSSNSKDIAIIRDEQEKEEMLTIREVVKIENLPEVEQEYGVEEVEGEQPVKEEVA